MVDVTDAGALVDAYIYKKAERLAADKKAEALKEEETALKSKLIAICIDGKVKSVGGHVGAVNYKRTNKPRAENWNKIYEYIYTYKAFELMQKRISEGAVIERWEDDITIPGVIAFPVDDLTIVGKAK